jgi:hypothetical protein
LNVSLAAVNLGNGQRSALVGFQEYGAIVVVDSQFTRKQFTGCRCYASITAALMSDYVSHQDSP